MSRRARLPALVVGVLLGSVLLVALPAALASRRDRPLLVALGDSVVSGTACTCAPYPTLVARGLSARVRNLARGGQTTSGLRGQLDEGATRRALGGADAVVLTVGANDFDEGRADDETCRDPQACFAADLAALGPALDGVLARLGQLVRPGTPVVVTGYWNVFRDGAVAQAHGPGYVAASTALTREVDAVLQERAARGGALFVDLAGPFGSAGDVTDLLARDGDHPAAAGHAVIARAVLPVLQRALGPRASASRGGGT